MFLLDDNTLALAASDLSNHLACPHLTQQRLAIARGERGKARPASDPHADLIRERGDAHEQEQLRELSERCGGHVDLTGPPTFTREGLLEAHARTESAMRDGAPLIFQATLFDGTWQGRADFLIRVDRPSDLGDYSYEVIDTKLARQVKPEYVHQLLLYSNLIAGIQSLEPASAQVLLGDGSTFPLELSDFSALHRHVMASLRRVVDAPAVETYPEPVAHCAVCALFSECRARRVADDHLSLISGAHRRRREHLLDLGLETGNALAGAPEDLAPKSLGQEQFDRLRQQAVLQIESRETGEPTRGCLEPQRASGFAMLPPSSPGDIFFDLEGDPYVGDGGLEYLWGWWTEAGGYECEWAHGLADEKRALEKFIDRVGELREQYPDLHIYHYAPHERSKLGSLAAQHATRELEVDDLLRNGVLVDLLAVVKQGMQVGEESYSLKALERHHGFVREELRVREGGGSIVVYENWLASGDADLLEAIRNYNDEDCRSTASLAHWVRDTVTPEAEAAYEVSIDDLREPEPEEDFDPPEWLEEVQGLIDALTADLDPDPALDSPEQARRRLLSHLLLFHRRESNPEWWRYFDLRAMTLDDLIWESDAIADLRYDETVPPIPVKQSLEYTYRFPQQESKMSVGDVQDPFTGQGHKLVAVEDGYLRLRKGKASPPPDPTALVGGQPIDAKALRNSLVQLARSVVDGGGSFDAALALLDRDVPRTSRGSLSPGVNELSEAALGLERSILPVQGPPGTGKTYRGARMILAALAEGRRVALTANSHAAIKNLLTEVESCAAGSGQEFDGVYKGKDYESEAGLVECVGDNSDVTGDYVLVAGTAWLLARPEHRESFDLLFVDEASQYSLANAVAASVCADSVVLLGDPQQLPQVTKAAHPGGAGAAVLEHILDGDDTIAEGHGVFLDESWRMHPDICEFVSERSYDGRLRPVEGCSDRWIEAPGAALNGAGLRSVPVEHEGRSQKSPEEAEVIGTLCQELLGGAVFHDVGGGSRPLRPDDILIVAPYNMAVDCISAEVPGGVRVGTVDRFQGQEAPVVFYAMTCSSAEEVPRGVGFLFDKNRLNVAVSRAQCLSVLVYSPALLDANCPDLETMRQLDGICRFVEVVAAGPAEAASIG